MADLLLSRKQDSAIVQDLAAEQTGTTPDGRPVYSSARGFDNDFFLTNVEGTRC